MPRTRKCRRISHLPDILYFKPAGIPARELDEVTLALDEMEAVRLADLEGLYQEEAAGRMNISRQTFANILASARRTIAEALVSGKALKIEGGNIEVKGARLFCAHCRNEWMILGDQHVRARCPRCGAPGTQP